jgi:hypothetical protein
MHPGQALQEARWQAEREQCWRSCSSRMPGPSHAHGLIAKIPAPAAGASPLYGRQVMGTSIYLRDHHFPNAYTRIAA